MTIRIDEIRSLSVKERLRLLGEIWESLSAEPAELPLTAAQRRELDRRVGRSTVETPPRRSRGRRSARVWSGEGSDRSPHSGG